MDIVSVGATSLVLQKQHNFYIFYILYIRSLALHVLTDGLLCKICVSFHVSCCLPHCHIFFSGQQCSDCCAVPCIVSFHVPCCVPHCRLLPPRLLRWTMQHCSVTAGARRSTTRLCRRISGVPWSSQLLWYPTSLPTLTSSWRPPTLLTCELLAPLACSPNRERGKLCRQWRL